MAVPKTVQQQEKAEGKKLKISVSISKYLKDRMDELVKQGEFASISEIISLATVKFLTELEAQGKLPSRKPPKTAEEIAEEIELKKHRPVKEIHAGEEEIK